MKILQPNFKTILGVSAPLMLGSATQQIIVLSDNVFLYHQSLQDFGAIALVGVFYLLITSIGFGFSRGGQILIARRYGESNANNLKSNFYTLLIFQIALAILFFLLIFFFADDFFGFFIHSETYIDRILEYIYPRSFGIFFSYIGFAFIAFYTGIANTRFIVIDTIILAVVNVILNYVLIFGKLGFEPMGIRGAAIASTTAEIVAFICFLFYMFFDRSIKEFKLLQGVKFSGALVRKMWILSTPIVLQSFIGLGSWFVFFALIEQKMGAHPLEISNLIRNVYLILSIPCWGFAAGINTLVSNMIGQRRPKAAISVIIKTSWMCMISTIVIALPFIINPEYFLYPLFGGSNLALVQDAIPSFWVLGPILLAFSLGTILLNSIMGAGATYFALKIQIIATTCYLLFAWFLIDHYQAAIHIVWTTEIIYWLIIFFAALFFLKRGKWLRFNL